MKFTPGIIKSECTWEAHRKQTLTVEGVSLSSIRAAVDSEAKFILFSELCLNMTFCITRKEMFDKH